MMIMITSIGFYRIRLLQQIIEEFQQVPDPIKKKKKVKDITNITTLGTGFKFNKQSFRKMNLSTFLAIFFAVIIRDILWPYVT